MKTINATIVIIWLSFFVINSYGQQTLDGILPINETKYRWVYKKKFDKAVYKVNSKKEVIIDDIDTFAESQVGVDICKGVSAYSSLVTHKLGDLVAYHGSLYGRTLSGWIREGTCGELEKSIDISILANDDMLIQFYPNPINSDFVNVTINNELWDGSNILIFDTNGSILREIKLKEKVSRINTSNLAAGVYFLTLVNKVKSYTKRMVKK